MTLTGIELGTFRLEAQCLNQMHHRVFLTVSRYMKQAVNQFLERNGEAVECCYRQLHGSQCPGRKYVRILARSTSSSSSYSSSSSSSYSTTALSVWPWLPLVSEQYSFPGWGCQPHVHPQLSWRTDDFLSGLSPLADQSRF